MNFKTTADVKVPKRMIEQVIGQDEAVEVITEAASQRRHVLLIGKPGTGKSMLGLALAELLPKENLKDILAFYNPNDESQPLIRELKAGEGRKLIEQAKVEGSQYFKFQNIIMFVLIGLSALATWWSFNYFSNIEGGSKMLGGIMSVGSMIGTMLLVVAFMFFMSFGRRVIQEKKVPPKLIVDNFNRKQAPFFDATGARSGALLGDVLHDPFQSGGLGTPANQRVVAGMIHKANMGVLFIDEIATLRPYTQQELLSSIQQREFPITGQSERSAGAMVRTEPVPCDFILVAAGNVETLRAMHPALRSRIRGFGYEAFMNESMKDTPENRDKLVVFVAQEVIKDGKIPHFDKDAVEEIIGEAKRRSPRKGHLTLKLRGLGGLIRAAGDIAKKGNSKFVKREHVIAARRLARPIEQQIADEYIDSKKQYEVIITTGERIGRVNGLAVLGSEEGFSGIILPIEAEVTPGGRDRKITATGKLGEIALEAVQNVSAIVKNFFGEDIKDKYDIYVQFLQTYEGVEGDSASVAVATAIISALKKIKVKQDVCMTGSLSVRGEVLPIGGVTSKIEAAIDAGIKCAIVPKANMEDIIISKDRLDKIKIIPVENIIQVLTHALNWEGKEKVLKAIKEKRV